MTVESVIEAVPKASPAATPAAVAEPALTVIEPSRGWQLINVHELWQYRELVYFLVWRDVKVRYKQTLLGAAWAVVQPLSMMVIFTVFLGRLASVAPPGVPYPLFVFAGLLPWTLFAAVVTAAGNSVVGSERLITKIYFPRLAVPFAAAGAGLIDFVIAFAMLLALMVWFGVRPSASVVLVVPVIAMMVVAGIGVGTLLAALNVAFRDVKYVIPFLVQLWMFATPTIYMQTDPGTFAGWRQVLLANPMIGFVSAFRSLTLGQPLNWPELALSSAGGLVLFFVGCLYFRRIEDGFADQI